MQFFKLIPNIMFVFLENTILTFKRSEYKSIFITFYRWLWKREYLSKYSSVLIEPLICDSSDDSEDICQQKFIEILISTHDK
jgi:hypothetical protein